MAKQLNIPQGELINFIRDQLKEDREAWRLQREQEKKEKLEEEQRLRNVKGRRRWKRWMKNVSTACGALDHIVVDPMDTAQHCGEYLKQHGVGIATFIGLDKMER